MRTARAIAIVVLVALSVVGLQAAFVVSSGSDGVASADPGDKKWTFDTNDRTRASPTVVDGTVYLPSRDGNLYAVDAETGTEQWSYPAKSLRSSPTVSDGTVYVGSQDNNVYAIDAETGIEEWSLATGDTIHSSPTVVDGTVYIGSYDNNVYAIDAETGTKEWSFSTSGDVKSSPNFVDGTVYIGSQDDNVYAIDAETGTEEWSFSTDGYVDASPTVANGIVYFGSLDNNLYALEAETGTKEWSYSTGQKTVSSPIVVDNTVYIGSYDETLYALEAETGTKEWSYSLGSLTKSSPTFADGTVYIAGIDGGVHAVDASTGTEEWVSGINNDIYSSPTVSGDTVYIAREGPGGDSGELVALETGSTADIDGSRNLHGTLGHNDLFEPDGSIGEPAPGSFTVLDPDGNEITDRDTRIELYDATDDELNNEPRYFLDEITRDPIATGSGSSIAFDAASYNKSYVVVWRSEDDDTPQYRDLAVRVVDITWDWTIQLTGNATVQQRVKIDDQIGNWSSERVTLRAVEIDSGQNRSQTALGSENLGTLWLNDSESYRMYAMRDDGAERKIGRLDVVRETSDHPAVFEIRSPADQFNESDIQNRTDSHVEPWNNESEISYPPFATVSASPAAPVAGGSVSFDASASTAYGDASIASYEWELPDGSTATGSTATWSTDSADDGRTATVTVTVTDSNGIEDTATHTLYVAEDAASASIPPAADARIDTDDPIVGEPVVLEDASSTAEGVDVETVEWDVDNDGSYEDTGPKVEFTPDEPGLKTVGFRVTDQNGVEDEIDVSFFVGAETSAGDDGGVLGGGGGGGGGGFGGPVGGGDGPTGAQQAALGIAGVGAYAVWRRSGGPGVVAVARRGAPMAAGVARRALSGVGTLARGTGRVARRLVGALT
jgi:outer membrane protein assembly factor BamB